MIRLWHIFCWTIDRHNWTVTGKTFLLNVAVDFLRQKGKCVIATASSGVAALELHGGRTAHSAFSIPTDVLDMHTCCAVSKQSAQARALQQADLILWDEISMADRFAIEAVSRLLQDLSTKGKCFGGKTVVFSGDFRQVLPVIPMASTSRIIGRTIKYSHLWKKITTLQLSQNLRALTAQGSDRANQLQFANMLLSVGNGTYPAVDPEDDNDLVKLPECMNVGSLKELTHFVFGSTYDADKMRNHAVLAPKNDCVRAINTIMLDSLPGEPRVYLSADHTENDTDARMYTPIEVVHSTTPPGMPLHRLEVKEGCPVLVLRNLNQGAGVCNGTRCIIRKCYPNSLFAEICNGSHAGEYTFIPRITLESQHQRGQLYFQRHQFPVQLCFAMTINKAQSQTLDRVGIHLTPPVFAHGQLYVAMSRVRRLADVNVLLTDEKDTETQLPDYCTLNIVHEAVLTNEAESELLDIVDE